MLTQTNKHERPHAGDIFALIIVIGALHLLALEREYYWLISWYDIMMHFLGGFWIAITAFWLKNKGWLPFKINFTRIIFLTMSIGLLWEVYELFFGLTFIAHAEYLGDTLFDLILNTFGALGAYLFIRKINR